MDDFAYSVEIGTGLERDGVPGKVVGMTVRLDRSLDVTVEFRVKWKDGCVMRYYSNDPGALKRFYDWVETAAVPF